MPTISLLDLKLKIIKNYLNRIYTNVVDPFFDNVTLLLHGNGINTGQNNTFLDSSANNFTVTRNGNVTQGTISPYGSNWSNYFDGTGDQIITPDNAAFDFGTGDFTIECWIYIAANSSADGNGNRIANIFSGYAASGVVSRGYAFQIEGNASTTGTGLSFYNNNNGTQISIKATTTIAQNTWHHVAVCRSGTTTQLFLNGSSVASGTLSDQNVNSDYSIAIGRLGYALYLQEFNGYISNLRVLKGTAQYTGSYTVPTSPLTTITNTSLLTCQSNGFRDASVNNFTITPSGNVSVERFSPFAPTAAYTSNAIGGSGYFDGLTDSLTVPYTPASFDWWTSDFTIEAWVYATSWSTWSGIHNGNNRPSLVGNMASLSTTNYWSFGPTTTGNLAWYYFNGSELLLSSSGTVRTSQWNHIAATKTSSGITFFINGVAETPIAISGTPLSSNSQPLVIGSHRNISISGYVSDLRIIKGTALYTGNFTPPTAPLITITNTSLLLNFQNAAIIDNAMMANLETAGNAQISTAVTKYGTGSLYFDGTGDYLSAPLNQAYVFGTGDFTVEYWLYPISNTSGCMVDLRTSESGNGSVAYSDFFTAAGKLGLYINANTYTSTSTVPTGQWTHIAVARSGNALRVFFNGVQDGSTVVNSQNLMGGKLTVGTNVALTGTFNGYLDGVRITKGIARYTSNFTPPTEQFPDL